MRFGACVLVPLQHAAARCVGVCALELGCWCCCRVPLPDVWPCVLWSLGVVWPCALCSLGAGAAAGCHCHMCGLCAWWCHVCFGASVLVPLQGAAARCVVLWSSGAGADAGCRCQTFGRVYFAAWVLVPLEVPPPDVWPCVLWSLGAAAAAGCRCKTCGGVRFGAWVLVPCRLPLPGVWPCQMCGRVRFGAWVLVPLQGSVASCVAVCAGAWVLVPVQGAAARCVAVCVFELGCWCCCRVRVLPEIAASRCRVPLQCAAHKSFLATWGLCWRNFVHFAIIFSAEARLSRPSLSESVRSLVCVAQVGTWPDLCMLSVHTAYGVTHLDPNADQLDHLLLLLSNLAVLYICNFA